MDIVEEYKKRLHILDLLYEETGEDTQKLAVIWDLGNQLGLAKEVTERAGRFLERKGIIEKHTNWQSGGHVSITKKGIDIIERARSNPDRPATNYFLPYNRIFGQ